MFNKHLYHDTHCFPGTPDYWDKMSLFVFQYGLMCGMHEDMRLLDIGCGPLREGRHLILFLKPGGYTGLEPEQEMVERGLLEPPLCPEIIAYKKPTFFHNPNFEVEGTYDMAIAIQVFFHCGPDQLMACLNRLIPVLHGPFLCEAWTLDEAELLEKDDQQAGFQYRYAQYKSVKYTREQFVTLCDDCGYSAEYLGHTFWKLEYNRF